MRRRDRGSRAQLSALGPSTSLVSLGIGGNDLGFSSVVANCAAVTPWGATKVGWSCRSHYTVNGVDELVSLVHQVGDRVAALLTDVRSRAPQARVFVIGYPDIVPANGRGCWPMLPFSSPDLDYVRSIEADLNDTLSRDASAAGDGYVNMATPSATTTPARRPPARWVEPIVPSPGTFPCTRARWVWPAWLGCSKAPSPRPERRVARHREARRGAVGSGGPSALHAERGGAQLTARSASPVISTLVALWRPAPNMVSSPGSPVRTTCCPVPPSFSGRPGEVSTMVAATFFAIPPAQDESTGRRPSPGAAGGVPSPPAPGGHPPRG